MVTVAEEMTARYCKDDTLRVAATRRRRWFQVIEGIQVADNWTDVFEPVRSRHWFSSRWNQIQSVKGAAAQLGAFLRERPDQA